MASNEVALRANSDLDSIQNNELALRPNYPLSRRQARETITIRNCDIIYRNFSGKAGPYNEEGERSFSVLLDEKLAQELMRRGMNVKPLKMRDEDTEQLYQLPVSVSYKVRAPRVYMVTGDGERMPLRKAMLDERLVHMMDLLELRECHLIIAVSNYEVRGTKGKKAYLQTFFGHVEPDELEQEYANVEDIVAEDIEQHADVDAHPVIEGEVVY